MTKIQFLYELDEKLSALSEADRDKSLEYYSEMIDDRMENGLSEREAVAALGSIDTIYNEIIADIPFSHIVGAKLRRSPKNATKSVWMWILIVFGFLVFGLPIISVAFAVIISLYAAIWTVVISLWVVPLVLLVGGAAGVILFFPTIFLGNSIKALFLLGAGIFSLGLVFPFFYIAKWTTKGAVILSRGMLIMIKKSIIR